MIKDKMKTVVEKLKDKKFLIAIFVIFYLVLLYCGLQTFAASDDLAYSFFYRGETRVSTISQILWNQWSDYLLINGRVVIHAIVQFLLMFDNKLFAILNPIVIIISFVYMLKIINMYSEKYEDKKNQLIALLLIISMFLILYNYKYLIYWVAGSLNYIWVFPLLIGCSYYYLKNGFDNRKIFICFISFFLAMLCECSLVFIIVLMLFDLLLKIIKTRKVKSLIPYIFYSISILVGAIYTLTAPGNLKRISGYSWWNEMNFFEKINLTIPKVSINLYELLNFENLIPTIFIVAFLYYIIKSNIKYQKCFLCLIILFALLSFIFSNGWLYLILAILIFITFLFINYTKNRNELSVVFTSFYAVSFSMILTPEYAGGRPNYHLYMFMIMLIIIFISDLFNHKHFKNVLAIIAVISFTLTLAYEYKIYSYIGDIHQERLKAIEKVKKEKLNVLELKKIKEPYSKYHQDSNQPASKDYWTYCYFVSYYNLSKDIEIKIVD